MRNQYVINTATGWRTLTTSMSVKRGKVCLGGMLIISFLLTFSAPSWADCGWQQKQVCGGVCCGGGGGGYQQQQQRANYSQQRQLQQQQQMQQQQVEQQRQAELAHQAELDRQRQEADERARQAEAARRAQFLLNRDATAATLRGSTGMSNDASALKSGFDTGGTGLKGLKSADEGRPALKSMAAAKTSKACPPGSDPMVVNACNVPSGLPKSVDEAIPHTPSGNRVRKGFEAIQQHDWQVALAWFKDAHNHAPNDPGILRLVDLAQYTLDRESQPAQSARPTSAAVTGADRKDIAKQLNDFNQNYLPKHPELMKGLSKQAAEQLSKPDASNTHDAGPAAALQRLLKLLSPPHRKKPREARVNAVRG